MTDLKIRVIDYCVANKTSQAKLAKQLGFSYNYFNSMVGGKKPPSEEFSKKIEALLASSENVLKQHVLETPPEVLEAVVEAGSPKTDFDKAIDEAPFVDTLIKDTPEVTEALEFAEKIVKALETKDKNHEISIGGVKKGVDVFKLQKRNAGKMAKR